MTHELEPVDEQAPGDTLEYIVTVHDEDDDSSEYKDLRGGSAEWALLSRDKEDVLYTDDDTGFSVTLSDAQNGEVTAMIQSGATDGEVGTRYQRFRVRDGDGRQKTYVGRIHFVDTGP